MPDCRAQCATGNGTPSICTKTTPSISGSLTVSALCPNRRSAAVNASSFPAVAIQVRIVPIAAAIQVAATRVQNEVASTPGSTSSAMCIATAWLVIASSATASHPMVVATAIRTGRIRMPKMAVTAAAATSCQGDEALRPGRRAAATISARELMVQARAIRPRSEGRSLADMRTVSAGLADGGVTRAG